MNVTWETIAAALEKAAKWFFRREHGKAVEMINSNREELNFNCPPVCSVCGRIHGGECPAGNINSSRLSQTRNPRSGKWQVIDKDKGEIIGTADEAEEGIEVAE